MPAAARRVEAVWAWAGLTRRWEEALRWAAALGLVLQAGVRCPPALVVGD